MMAPTNRPHNRHCCISECEGCSDEVKLYKFPSNRSMFNLWKQIMEINNISVELRLDSQGRCNQRICCRHFEAKYIKTDRRRLFNSIPTLFTANEMATGVPKRPITIDWERYGIAVIGNISDTRKRILTSVHLDHDYAQTKRIKIHLQPDAETTLASTSSTAPGATESYPMGPELYSGSESALASTSSAVPGVTQGHPMDLELCPGSKSALASTSFSALATTRGHPMVPKLYPGAEPVHASTSSAAPGTRDTAATPICRSVQRTRTNRTRLVKSVQILTPRCKKMYRKCLGIINSKTRLINKFEDRLQKAQELSEQQSFMAMVEQLPNHTKTFMYMQINQANKHINRRRFTTNEKLLALTLLKQSPKGYKLLQKLFILPTRRTLNTFTQEFVMNPGLNRNILKQLTETVKSWDTIKKACAIVFDEMSIAPHLTFVEAEDAVTGFVNFGQGTQKKFCDHSLVFMVRGICSSWRQMVAFYFCEGTTPAVTLKNILREIVEAVSQTGLLPMALVCDQGSTFQTCLKSFQEDSRRERLLNKESEGHKININGHKLNIIYDPPHLIKGIRNNFLTKDFSFCGKTAKWNDIIEVYQADCQLGDIRMLNKLTDEHVFPAVSQRMKVKTCTQVLSERMSAMLRYTSKYETHDDGRQVSRSMKNTADAVLFWDRLFDSVNGSRRGAADSGKMRGPVQDARDGNNKHVSFWKEAIGILENSFFFESSPSGNITKKWVPSLANWIITLNSFIDIWSDLKNMGVRFFYTRNLNQDPLENFFGRIRALNHRFNQSDAYSFQCSFKTLLITNTLGPHSPHSNCEDDMGTLLFTLNRLIQSSDTSVPEPQSVEQEALAATTTASRSAETGSSRAPSGLGGAELFRQVRKEKTSVQASAFTAGYVTRKLIAKFKCQACKHSFLTDDHSDLHSWISYRERQYLRGRNLKYPTPAFVMLFRLLIQIINSYMDEFPHRPHLLRNIKSIFLNKANIDFFGCPQHHSAALHMFIVLVCRVQIHNYCNTINKILKGAFSEHKMNSRSAMQRLAFNKRKKFSGAKKTIHK